MLPSGKPSSRRMTGEWNFGMELSLVNLQGVGAVRLPRMSLAPALGMLISARLYRGFSSQ